MDEVTHWFAGGRAEQALPPVMAAAILLCGSLMTPLARRLRQTFPGAGKEDNPGLAKSGERRGN
ncbi:MULTISPECIES: hypothetical protein [unclassified Spirillospora]|uniref:hypothetical protein n=1 Tax=unclassified Spirillospora TaxID=2642701 RepID=UPI003721DDC0